MIPADIKDNHAQYLLQQPDINYISYVIIITNTFYEIKLGSYIPLVASLLFMLHCNRYFILLAALSTWLFAQSLGDQTNEASQVQGALSSAMVDPSSLYNF